MSALLMAIYFHGLSRGRAARLDRGDDRLGRAPRPVRAVDAADRRQALDRRASATRSSLILAPLVAACGAAVPQLSGRGLGHTGGTLDKLESIPGFRVALSNGEHAGEPWRGWAVSSAPPGAGLAPADRRLYALRDVTGTVESIPLIASSIMSKKIAEGTAALVLDVKVGSGAFMTDRPRPSSWPATMVALGEEHGVRTRALLTRMDTPLGRAVGNAWRCRSPCRALQGDGPAGPDGGHPRAGRRDARAGRAPGRRPGRPRHAISTAGPTRRGGHGPRAGRRPGRPAAARPRTSRPRCRRPADG